MYACVVKNSQETWDVFSPFGYTSNQEKYTILNNAVESNLPITGMIMTPHKWSASHGATWNGESFTGGIESSMPLDIDWESVNTYGYICNNIFIGGFSTAVNSEQDLQFQAIFESETTVIKVPEGQTANVGDIWDGTNIITKL